MTDADFLSLDSTGADGPRGADGSLPVLDDLRLAPGGDLDGMGANAGPERPGAASSLGPWPTP